MTKQDLQLEIAKYNQAIYEQIQDVNEAISKIVFIMRENRNTLINEHQESTSNGYKCGLGWTTLYHSYDYLCKQSSDLRKEIL